jgi:hypothetical protein
MNTNTHISSRSPSAALVLAEALAGGLVGLLLAVVAGFAAARIFAGSSSGWGDLIGAIMGSLIGYTIGVSIGVAVVGRRLNRRGSYWPALVGSIFGAALVLLLAEPLRLNASAALLQGSVAVVTPLLSALAFHAGLRLRK